MWVTCVDVLFMCLCVGFVRLLIHVHTICLCGSEFACDSLCISVCMCANIGLNIRKLVCMFTCWYVCR